MKPCLINQLFNTHFCALVEMEPQTGVPKFGIAVHEGVEDNKLEHETLRVGLSSP